MQKKGTQPEEAIKGKELIYLDPGYEFYQGTIHWLSPPSSLVRANLQKLIDDPKVLAIWMGPEESIVAGKA